MEHNPVLDAIYRRRSIRKYSAEQIADEALEAIVEAGRCAPSGRNSQTTHFVVIQNPAIMAEMKETVIRTLAEMEVPADAYSGLIAAAARAKKGEPYDFSFSAPTFIVVANKRGYANDLADCSAALENMMVAAVSLGLGTCWVNQLRWVRDEKRMIEWARDVLEIPEDEIICGSISVGIPEQFFDGPIARRGNPVTWLR